MIVLASHFEDSYGEILTIGERKMKLQKNENVDNYKPFMSDNLIRRPNPEIKFEWRGRRIQGRFRTNETRTKTSLKRKQNFIHKERYSV